MSVYELVLLGIGLAMDAAGVSMTNAMVYRDAGKAAFIAMPVFFGAFQAAMPVAGYFAGSLFASIITRYSGIVIFIILGAVGGKMVFDAVKEMKKPEDVKREKKLGIALLLLQSVATSIDAFAVGIGFSAAQVDIAGAVSIIGAVTAAVVCIALFIGRKFGDFLGSRAEIFGGAVLIFIGVKSLFN